LISVVKTRCLSIWEQYLCLERLDIDFIVLDRRSAREREFVKRLFDGSDRHWELIKIVVGRAVPIFG
jgi:hypothetical protein